MRIPPLFGSCERLEFVVVSCVVSTTTTNTHVVCHTIEYIEYKYLKTESERETTIRRLVPLQLIEGSSLYLVYVCDTNPNRTKNFRGGVSF